MNHADNDIERLSKALSLNYQPQDWGIINADPRRILEFIRGAEVAGLSVAQQYAMAELVLASVNEQLLKSRLSTSEEQAFKVFLRSTLNGLSSQIRYWSNLRNSEEFPISAYLNELGIGRSDAEEDSEDSMAGS